MRFLRALSHRPFALLWSGQTISRLGDSLYRIALAWWVLEKTGSATAMASILVFSTLPMLLFVLLGGVAVDRFSRQRVMLISDLLRGAIVACIATLAALHLLEVWHVYLASIVFGLVGAFFQPAYSATVPETVPAEALPSANSLTSLSAQFSGVLGPALGAGIVAAGGTSFAFGLDALSFLISAAALVPLLRLPRPLRVDAQKQAGVLADVRDGFRLVLSSPWLWVTIAVSALGNVTIGGTLGVATPFLVSEHLHQDVGALGLLNSLFSAGMVGASLWLGHLPRLRRRGLASYTATLVTGAAILAYGLPVGLAGVAAAAVILGASIAVFSLIWTNSLQELVPREMLGRVSSIDYLGSFVLLPVGYGVAGLATDRLGAPFVFVVSGAVTMALAVLGLCHPAIRKLD